MAVSASGFRKMQKRDFSRVSLSINQSINQSITILTCQVDLAYICVKFIGGRLTTCELKVKKKYINLI